MEESNREMVRKFKKCRRRTKKRKEAKIFWVFNLKRENRKIKKKVSNRF
jgi:hypothetical protein